MFPEISADGGLTGRFLLQMFTSIRLFTLVYHKKEDYSKNIYSY
jgi:hypothetical protein